MKSFFKPVLLAAVLATAGFAAFSQVPAAGQDCMMGQGAMYGGMHNERMGKFDPAKMQARMDQRSAALKAQLKLTPAQEAAWNLYRCHEAAGDHDGESSGLRRTHQAAHSRAHRQDEGLAYPAYGRHDCCHGAARRSHQGLLCRTDARAAKSV